MIMKSLKPENKDYKEEEKVNNFVEFSLAQFMEQISRQELVQK